MVQPVLVILLRIFLDRLQNVDTNFFEAYYEYLS
jgi:hypothetical protein